MYRKPNVCKPLPSVTPVCVRAKVAHKAARVHSQRLRCRSVGRPTEPASAPPHGVGERARAPVPQQRLDRGPAQPHHLRRLEQRRAAAHLLVRVRVRARVLAKPNPNLNPKPNPNL